MSEELLSVEQREELFAYWDKIPIIAEIDVSQPFKKKSAKIHKDILVAISKGVDDPVLNKRRRGLSANEILQNINGEEETMTLPSLYYHLQKLIEIKEVEVILEVKTGRHVTKYYGRTAKLHMLVFSEDKDKKQKKKESDTEMLEIIRKFDPSFVDSPDIDSLFGHHKEFYKWITIHGAKFSGTELDLIKVSNLYQIVKFFKENMGKLEELIEILELT